MKLNDIVKELNGIQYILKDEAEEICEIYSKKNRKKNNQVEYQMNDAKTQLFRIYRESSYCGMRDWCAGFILSVTTQDVVDRAIENLVEDI